MAAAATAKAATKVLVTGGSGLLGRAIVAEFGKSSAFDVTGTAFSRATDVLRKLDLRDADAVRSLITELKPSIIVHAAAERRPDVCEGDDDATKSLNVDAVTTIGQCAAEVNAWVVYISTDYVFDGTSPPYKVDAKPNPLNKYGRSKAAGEVAIQEALPSSAVLRVPVLFGRTKKLSESAITTLVSGVEDASAPKTMDGWAKRYPTFCDDVAVVLRQFAEAQLAGKECSGYFHWSGSEEFTKYELSLLFAKLLGLPSDHLVNNTKPAAGTPRPRDCHLDTSRLQALGIGQHTPVAKALRIVLEGLGKKCVAEEEEDVASAASAAGGAGAGGGAGAKPST